MHVDKRIREESERVEFYLQDCSRKTLMTLLDAAYIIPHLMLLAEKGAGCSLSYGAVLLSGFPELLGHKDNLH